MLRTIFNNSKHMYVLSLENRIHSTKFIPSLNLITSKTQPNLTFSHRLFCPKYLHTTAKNHRKIFQDTENHFAYQLLPTLPISDVISHENYQLTSEDFEKVLNGNWRQSTAPEILEAFEKVQTYCIEHDINLSDSRFDKLIDGLMDHCEKFTDNEMLKLLSLLKDFPQCDSVSSHNFADVWSCLDDICCWKMNKWSLEKSFVFARYWFLLNLGRVSDYMFELLDRIPRKLKHLNKATILHTCFYYNVCRKKEIQFDFEDLLARSVKDFNVDELGIVAMAYFKTQSKVKLPQILSEMIRKVGQNHSTIHDITLASILKTIRFSQKFSIVPELEQMLDSLVDEIPRFSNATCVHIALVGTTIQYKHEATLKAATSRVLKDIRNTRIKDVERILIANAMFDFDPGSNFYQVCLDELQSEEKLNESVTYTRCLPSALNFLAIRNMYSIPLMDKLLNEEYICEVFGKNAKMLPRELFFLDISIDIEVPDYKGNRLNKEKRYKAAKWLTEFTPERDQYKSFSPYDKFYLDLVDHVAELAGGKEYLAEVHALPHYSKSDIILCVDKATGNFVKPFGFGSFILGDVYRPDLLDKYHWLALVTLTPNTAMRNTTQPLGIMVAKERQLKKIGYKPFYVAWNDFQSLDKVGKIDYLQTRVYKLIR